MKQPTLFPRVVCWNAEARQQAMNTEALRVRESVFRATHFPCPIHELNAKTHPPTTAPYTEERLVRDLLADGAERLFCVVKGDSGTGKSHLIRWLWREVESRTEKHWKIVRVPRHAANLADVLGTILAKDFHGEEIERIRNEIKHTANLTHVGAMRKVLDELAFVLEPQNRERSQLEFPDDEDHQEVILPLLPALLRDQAFRKFQLSDASGGIVKRLAFHIMGAREQRPDSAGLRWSEHDLEVSVTTINSAGADARQLAAALLQDERLREMTAAVLNRAFEDAGPALVGLKRGNLRAAMLEIRRQLRSSGKELLLFIEDLSVSQGMDGELIESLLVTPAVDDGGADLCVLRSVVGVTNEDFQQMLDNIRTRIDLAVAFDVPLHEGERKGVTDAECADFASRYLNAARYTLQELDEWLEETGGASEPPSACVASGCPNREVCHRTFGEVDGRGLYPFTLTAIARLYRGLQHGEDGREVRAFNPRLLVSGVLKRTLEEAEVQLPGNTFPATSFLEWFKLTEVASELQVALRQKYGDTEAGRIRTALEIFAHSPNRGDLPKHMAECLGVAYEGVEQVEVPRDTRVDPPPPKDDVFKAWLNKGRLDDSVLNTWRSAVHKAMRGAREWDSDPIGPWFTNYFLQRFIHFEEQHPARAGDVQITIKRTPENTEAIRYLVSADGGRTGLLLAMQCVEEWTEDVCGQLQTAARVAGQPKPLAVALHVLALGALVRGLVPDDADTATLLAAMLNPWPDDSAMGAGRSASWGQLFEALSRSAPKLRDWVLRRISGSKGGQIGAGMIDIALVLEDLRSAERRVVVDIKPDVIEGWNQQLYQPVIEITNRVGKLLSSAIVEEVGRCREYVAAIDTARGSGSARELGRKLQDALRVGIQAAVFDDVRIQELVPRCESFINGRVEDLAQIARCVIASDVPRNRQLRLLAQLDCAEMADSVDTLRRATVEFAEVDEYLNERISAAGGDELVRLTEAVRNELARLRRTMQSLTGDTDDDSAS